MHRYIVFLVNILLLSIALTGTHLQAQNAFEDAVKQISSDNVKGYLQPMIDSFGANLNTGLFGPAVIPDGFHLQLRIIGMTTLIGKSEQTYMAVPPPPFPQSPVQTATVFGDLGTVLSGPSGMRYTFQNGQIKTDYMPFAAPQITIGNYYGTQAIIRYVPVPSIEDFPDIKYFGIGVRHEISRHFSGSPVDIAGGFFYQILDIGDILSANSIVLNAQASKTYSVLTLYGGLQYETFSIDLDYRYTGPLTDGDPSSRDVSLSLEGQNNFRVALGFGLSLGILYLNGDINIGKVIVLGAGLGLGI